MSVQILKIECRRLNARTGTELQALVDGAWASGATVVGLDFSEVAAMDSLGLSALVAVYRRCPPNAKLVLCALNAHVKGVIELTRLSSVFRVYDTPQDVMAIAN